MNTIRQFRLLLIYALLGAILNFTVSCKKNDNTIPAVSTAGVSAIAHTTAQCGGIINADGGAVITERGVCWSTNQTPIIANYKTTDGTGAGSFTSSITGLTKNTIYYL